jgi:hypothetical protein
MKRLILWLALCGCPEGTTPPAGFPDATTDEDGGPVDPGGPKFDFEVVVGENSNAIYGDDLRLALSSDGRPAVAYAYYNAGSGTRELHVAERASDGTWTDELAIVPGANAPSGGDTVGIGFGYVGNVPHLTYIGGDDDMRPTSPYPTDLMLATRQGGNWDERTLVDLSNEAMTTCPANTQDYCNFGGVVGTHASFAPKPGGGGFAVVYRDTHNSFGLDDLRRSDTEVYAEGGPFTNSNVDPGRGSGEFGDIAWLPNGNLVVAYSLGEQVGLGVWAAVFNNGMWTTPLVQVSTSEARSRVSLGVDPSGTIWLAFNDSASDLVVASSDDGTTWTIESVDASGYTGLHPSLAIDTEGRPVVAYTYCGTTGDCPGSLGEKSVVRLARREGAEWKIYLADDGEGFGNVGLFNSIAIQPDGKIAIAYQHARNKDVIYLRER